MSRPSPDKPRQSGKTRSDNSIPDDDKIGEFLSKTYAMVADPANSEVVAFLDDDDGFVVKNEKEFTAKLFEYFRHSNFSSFVRQLNFYGFSKRSTKQGCNYFKRKYFNRAGDQLHLIKRKQSDTTTTSNKISTKQLQDQITELKQQSSQIINTQSRVIYILLSYLQGTGAIHPQLFQQQPQQITQESSSSSGDPVVLGKREHLGSDQGPNKRPRLSPEAASSEIHPVAEYGFTPDSMPAPAPAPGFGNQPPSPMIWQDFSQLQAAIAGLPRAQEILGSTLSGAVPRNLGGGLPMPQAIPPAQSSMFAPQGFPGGLNNGSGPVFPSGAAAPGSRRLAPPEAYNPSDAYLIEDARGNPSGAAPLIMAPPSPSPRGGFGPWAAESPAADSDGVYEVDTGAWAQKQLHDVPDPNLAEEGDYGFGSSAQAPRPPLGAPSGPPFLQAPASANGADYFGAAALSPYRPMEGSAAETPVLIAPSYAAGPTSGVADPDAEEDEEEPDSDLAPDSPLRDLDVDQFLS